MATGLDERGDISIAIICIYVPIFFLALLLTLRHGFSRQAGWISLLIFTICMSLSMIHWVVFFAKSLLTADHPFPFVVFKQFA